MIDLDLALPADEAAGRALLRTLAKQGVPADRIENMPSLELGLYAEKAGGFARAYTEFHAAQERYSAALTDLFISPFPAALPPFERVRSYPLRALDHTAAQQVAWASVQPEALTTLAMGLSWLYNRALFAEQAAAVVNRIALDLDKEENPND